MTSKMIQDLRVKFFGLYFADVRLYEEFLNVRRTDPRVRMRAIELGLFAYKFNKRLQVMYIGRSKKSNIEIYGCDQQTGHRELPARAIDFSIHSLDMRIITELKNYFSMFLDDGRYYSLIHHDAGHGDHLHLQVPHRKNINKILWDTIKP